MSRFSSIVRGQLTKSEEKRAAVERAAQQKRDDLNPEYAFNINAIDITDADSVRDRQTGAELRFGGGEGNDFDAYESTPFGYDQNPVKEAIHKQSYADAFGVKLEDVTRDMLLERGQLQKSQFAERLANAADENGNIRYKRRGIDNNNRVIADIQSNENTAQFLQDAGDRDNNAGYSGKFNFLRSLEDFQSGDTVDHNFGRGERSKTEAVTDQLSGFVAGTGDMAIGLAQTGAVLLGQGQRSAEAFDSARESVQSFREAVQSDEKLRGDRLASKRSEQRRAISSMRKAQYVAGGDGEVEAGIKAGVSEYVDTAQDFWNNPGRALDAFSESLPYMLGVGAAGSSAARIATNKLRTETFKDLAALSRAAGSRKGAGKIGANAQRSTIAETRAATEKFLHSPAGQKIISKTVDRVGIGTVGLTEGMTNAADVFSEVMKMSEEEAFQSEAYSELRAQGKSHEDALYELAQGAWAQSLVMTTALAGAAAKLTGAGAFEARMFTGIRNPAKAAAGKGAPKPTIAGRHYISPKQAGKELAESQGRKAPTAAKIKKGREKIIAKRAGVKPSRIPGIVKGTGKALGATGRVLKEPGKAAGKEFVEESIQSGGGELLGQISKQKATGEEIGPGVGEATAEGGIVGFLSGGLVSSVTGGFKKGAEKIANRKKGEGAEEANKTFVDTSSTDHPTAAVGGDSVKAIVQSTQDPNYKPIDSINGELDQAEADPTGKYGFDNFNAINIHYEKAALQLEKAINEATDKGDTEALGKLNEQYDELHGRTKKVVQQFGQVMTNTLREAKPRFKDGTATVNDLAMLDKASRTVGFVVDPEIVAAVGDSTRAVLAQNKSINDLIGSLDDPKAAIDAELIAQGVEADSPAGQKIIRDMTYAHREKMSNTRYSIEGTDAVDVRGVGRYVQDISDALQRNAPKEVAALTTKLQGFVTSQAEKLVRLKGIKQSKPKTYQISLDKEGKPSGKTYTYSEAGIDALIATVTAEQAPMQKLLDLVSDKAVTYAQVQKEGVGLSKAVKVESAAFRAMKKAAAAMTPAALIARAKKVGIAIEGLTHTEIAQKVATYFYNKENAPKGSDTPKPEEEKKQPEAASTVVELDNEDAPTTAYKTPGGESGGAFLKRITPAMRADPRTPILTTTAQNKLKSVSDFLVRRGYVRDHTTEAGNIVWTPGNGEANRTTTQLKKDEKANRVTKPKSILDDLAVKGLDKSTFPENFQDYKYNDSSNTFANGKRLFRANSGVAFDDLPSTLNQLDPKTYEQLVKGEQTAADFIESELFARSEGNPLTVSSDNQAQQDSYLAQEQFDDAQVQADQELEAQLPQPAPVAEPAARQGKPGEGTQEDNKTPYERGQTAATNAYDALIAENATATNTEVNTALGKGGRNLSGLEKEGYNDQAEQIQKDHKPKEDGGKTTSFNTAFDAIRTRLKDARSRQATATGQEATTVGEEVDALLEEAEQLVNEHTDDVTERVKKLKTLGNPAPLAQLRQVNPAQQALDTVKSTQTALKKGVANFQRKFSGMFPTIADVHEVINEGGSINQYERVLHKDIRDLWAFDAANDAAMAAYTNAKLGRTAEQAAETDQKIKDIETFRKLSPANRIEQAFGLGLTVTAAEASKAGLPALTKKVVDRQAELRAESAVKSGSAPALAQLTQDVSLESNLENLNEEDAPIVGANNVLFALRNDTRDKLTKLITYLKDLMGDTVIPSIQYEITTAEAALVQLDNGNMTRTEMQRLSSRIHEATEKRLRSDDFQYLEHQSPTHQQTLLALAEIGSDGTLTVAMRDARDKLLRDLLTVIEQDIENGVDSTYTDSRVLNSVYAFLRDNPKSWQNAFLAGGVRLTDYKDDLHNVLEGTAKNSLPTKLADSFKSASKEASSYLTIFPNYSTKLANDFNNMEPELDLYPAVAAFQTFHDEFRTQLLSSAIKWGPDSKSKQSIFYRKGLYVVKEEDNRILQDPMWMLRDSFGNINENLITAMALESFLYATGTGQRTLYNTPAEINRIVGRPSNEDPLDDEIDVLSTVGDGIEQVYDLIAAKLMQHINIKGTGLTTGQLRTTMPRALAARAVTTLGEMGIVTVKPVDLSQFEEDQETAVENERKFVRLQMEDNENLPADRFSARVRALHSNAIALSETGHLEAMFGPIAKSEEPSFEPFEDVETKIRKTAMVAPKETSAGTKAHQDRALTRNTILVSGIALFPEPEQYLQVAHGYQPDLRAVHKTKIENIRGRNGNFVRDYENSFRWMQSMDKAGAELFYVKNRNITNLRTMEVSVHANNQASKLQRPLFPKDESMDTFSAGMTTTTAYKSAKETGFFRSVAQKLGGKLVIEGRKVKVEYLSDEVMLEHVDALIEEWQDYIDAINDPQDKTDPARPVFDATQVKLFIDSGMDKEENGETYNTLLNLAALQQPGTATEFRMFQPVQTDSTTSGFANSLMQLATASGIVRVKEALRRVGMSFKEDPISATQYMQANPDSYEIITQKISDIAGFMTAGLGVRLPKNGAGQLTGEVLAGNPLHVSLSEAVTELNDLLSQSAALKKEQKNKINALANEVRILSVQTNERLLGFSTNTLGLDIDGNPQGVIPDLVGTDGVTSAGRNYSKPSFMLGNYNAGRRSAKRALASGSYSTMLDMLSEIDDADTLQGAMEEILLAKNEMVAILQKVDDPRGKSVKITPNVAELATAAIESYERERQAKYRKEIRLYGEPLIVNLGSLVDFATVPALPSVLKQIFSDTYGEALHIALDSELDYLMPARDAIHQMAFMANATFQVLFKARVDRFTEVNGVPDVTQMKSIIDKMVNEGLFPAISSAVSTEMNDKIEAVKRETLAFYINNERVRGKLGFEGASNFLTTENEDGQEQRKSQTTLSFTVLSQGFKEDSGVVMAVRAIQAIEAVIQTDLLAKYAMTNTYDGQGARGDTSRDIAVSANESAIKRNHDYNIFEAANDMLASMMRVLHSSSNQLTGEQKNQVFKAIQKKDGRAGESREVVDKILAELASVQADINRGRDRIWEDAAYLNNYMESPHSELSVAKVLGLTPTAPRIYETPNASIDSMSEEYDRRIHAQEDHNKDWMIRNLGTKVGEGINAIGEGFKDFIRAEPKKTMGVGYFMDLLAQALRSTDGNEELTGVVQKLHTYLKTNDTNERNIRNIRGIRIHLSETVLKDVNNEDADGLFYPKGKGNNARIELYAGATNFIPTAMHEIFHAVVGEYINKAAESADNTAEFEQIVRQANAIIQNMLNSSDASKQAIGAILNHIMATGDLQAQKNAISEVISNVTSTFIRSKAGRIELKFIEHYTPVLASLTRMIEMATEEPAIVNKQADGSPQQGDQMGLPFIHEGSSAEEVNTVDFLRRHVKQLPGQQVAQVFKEIEQLDSAPPSKRHNEILDSVIARWIVPNNQLLNSLTVKIATKPGSARNLGQVDSITNDAGKVLGETMYLEAAGNQLTSNVDLSLKEVTTHEYLHPVVRWAIKEDWYTHKKLKSLFEAARDKVKWHHFMPRVPSGDLVYAQQQARARYDYVFNNPKGDLSEFLINGLVNEELISILAEVDAPNTTQPVWEGPTYKTLTNIMGRLMRFFTKAVYKSKTGKVDAELEALMGHITALNMQAMNKGLHRARTGPPLADTANGWLSDQIGRKIADPLRKWRDDYEPSPTKNKLKDYGFVTATALVDASNNDFQKYLDTFFRQLGVQKDNTFGELASELMPSQKGLQIYKEMFRKSHHIVDRARRSEIEHMQKMLRAHFDPDRHFKHRRADKAALTHIGMRADLSALLGSSNNFERLQSIMNSPSALDGEIAARTQELSQVTNGDTQLYNLFHNQAMGLAEISILGQTFRANVQQNPYMIAHQNFFTDDANKRPLQDVAKAEAILDELKTLFSLKIAAENTPDMMSDMRKIMNHEMGRDVAINGIEMFMNMHIQFKEQSKKRLFKNNPVQMSSGYVYEQYNPDIDLAFTTETLADIQKMEDKGYKRIGVMPRDPRDPLRTQMIMWKGLNGKAMYMKAIVSPTDLSARGHDLIDQQRMQPGMTTSSAASQARYNLQKLKVRMEKDVLAQMANPNVQADQARAVPVYNELGDITNYRYMMTQNHKQTLLESNQSYDYLLGRMFGSIVDKEASLEINSKTAKLLHKEYVEGYKNEQLRFVEVGANSKDPKVREMWRMLPEPMKEELRQLFGGDYLYVRDDVVKLTFGFRKATIGNAKFLGKGAFAARAAERVWFDVIRLLKMKIVLTMPDVVIGNMASNIAYLLGDGIPLDFVAKEIKNGLKGIYAWQKDEEDLFKLEKAMDVRIRTHGAPTQRQVMDKLLLQQQMANNPIATLAEQGVFTGIADELEPDAWNYRNKIMQWASEKTDSWVPASVVSASKEVLMVPGSETFKVALAATQYADFIARHVMFKYDTEVRGREQEESLQRAIDAFIYYDIPQNVWLQYANDLGVLMFTKYFFRIQQQVYRLYKNSPLSALSVLGFQRAFMTFPYNSNIGDYALLDNFDITARLHLMPLRTMDNANMFEPALYGALAWPFRD